MRRHHKFMMSATLAIFLAIAVDASGYAEAAATGSAQAQVVRSTRVLPNVNFAMPPTAKGCRGAVSLTGGASRVPITVRVVKGQVEELANVCIAGKGPFPFEIDTGAGISLIASSLAQQLGLPDLGGPSESFGIGCTLTSQPVVVGSWTLAGLNLAAQPLISATLPDFGTSGQPVGLLGSDVLLRFGAVRIDFARKTMTMAGPEGSVPTGNVAAHGLTGPPPPRVVTHGQRGTTVPANVIQTPGNMGMTVNLRFSDGPRRTFSVDTGTTQSVVSRSVATIQHLASTNLLQTTTSSCATITVPLVHSGSWSIPGVRLHPQLLESISFQAATTGGNYGTLGSDQLYRYGWVIFDYSGGRLILG